MILSELRDYLKTHRRVALTDIAHHFNSDPDALRAMLQKWVVKGKVVKQPTGSLCGGGCCHCDPLTLEIYQWIG
ncbi:MAG: FeoC-like transcriptional regulator [Candidatus Competibacteraceae bacterium]|jgi:hypothetical protein|nr:FeoC-like transcriptional regulator [Candidatus Competibacteraceae bacterium]